MSSTPPFKLVTSFKKTQVILNNMESNGLKNIEIIGRSYAANKY